MAPSSSQRGHSYGTQVSGVKSVEIGFPAGSSLILGQTHFIKTIEDLYEIMVNTSAHVKFGIAFCEASGP